MSEERAEEPDIKVLLVEDDQALAALIQEYLHRYEFTVATEHRGDTAAARVAQELPDVLVLDLNLPGKDGLDVCREVRPVFDGPIVMFTARDEDLDQVVGLELGADDYLTKPVQPRVLLARLRALVRRISPMAKTDPQTLRFGDLLVDARSRSVSLGESSVALSTSEFDLLWQLANCAGEVIDREALLQQLRGIEYDGLDRSVDIRISRLRKKLGDDSTRPFRIKTVRGKGYLFVADAWEVQQ